MKIKLSSLCVLLTCNLYSQVYHSYDTIHLSHAISDIQIDVFNNIYVSDLKGNIYAYDDAFLLRKSFRPAQLGHKVQFDLQNTGKILVFYPESQIVVYLDRFLFETSRLDLSRFSNRIVTEVAPGDNNTVWCFDELANVLFRIDPVLNQVDQEIYLQSSYSVDEKLKSFRFIEGLFVFESDNHLSIYTSSGNSLKNEDMQSFTVSNQGKIYFRRNCTLYEGDIFSPEIQSMKSHPASCHMKATRSEKNLIFYDEKTILISLP